MTKEVIELKKISVILICVFSISSLSIGQTKDWQEPYDKSFDYFYNYEYERAVECLKGALKLDPSQPAIYWRLSYVLWLKAERTYQEHNKKVDKDARAQFNEITNRGIKICEKILESNPYDSEVLFYLGALYGHQGKFIATTNSWAKVTLKGSKILDLINKSREELRKIKNNELFYYAALGYLGLYHYGLLVVPKIAWGRAKENKDLSDEQTIEWGSEELQEAMKHSKYSDDVRMMHRGILQIKIQKEDNEFRDKIPEAIKLTEDLLRKYPRNLNLKIDLVVLYQKKGELIKAYDMGSKLQSEILKHPEYSKFHYIRYLYIKLGGVLSEIGRTLKK